MNTNQLLLIDLSAIAHQIWHVSGNEPDPSHVSNQIVARVRSLASAHPYAAICCDAGKSFRADIDTTYKANRDTENRAPLRHQMDVACETLKHDGFPVWRVQGMEADDLIATAVKQATDIEGTSVLIASSDKDLLQLVTDRVTTKSLTTGNIIDADGVVAKFGVHPDQMLDYLSLVGDVSDNVKGAKGIGGVIAAKLLKEFGTIQAIYDAMSKGVVKSLTPSLRSSMVEFQDRWPTVRSLIALRSDVEIPFAEIAVERVAAPMEMEAEMMSYDERGPHYQPLVDAVAAEAQSEGAVVRPSVPFEKGNDANDAPLPFTVPEPTKAAPMPDPRPAQRIEPKPTDIAVQQSPAQRIEPVDFSQQLEPRDTDSAIRMAQRLFDSKLFLGTFGTPQAVLAVILAGRELGMGAMKSLRSFHIIESKPTMSADLIAGQVLSSGKAKYFKPTQRSATSATFKTLRVGDEEEPFELVYTIEEAKQAWKKDQAAWDKSGWGKNPADMLVARCKSKLARLVFPDVVAGLYAPEEIE